MRQKCVWVSPKLQVNMNTAQKFLKPACVSERQFVPNGPGKLLEYFTDVFPLALYLHQ